jgi:hypothetical protein
MTISLKHKFVSSVPDDGDTTRVRPSNWNEEHNITMASGFVLGRLTAGTGDAEEISAASLLTWLASAGAVVGPASATDNAIARFDATTGKLIQNSSATIDDSGNITAGPTVQARRGSSGNVTLSLFQTGVQEWQLVNRGTTGVLEFTNTTITPLSLYPTTGNINIGGGAAAYKLTVTHNANSQNGVQVQNPNNGASAAAMLFLEGAIANSSLQFNLWANSGAPYAQIAAASAVSGLYVDAALHVWRSAAQVEWAQLTASGMTVGATASEGHHVLSSDATDATHRMFVSGGATGWAAGLNRPGASAGTNLVWSSFASATWTERMRLGADGALMLQSTTLATMTGVNTGALLIRGGAGAGEFNAIDFATTGSASVARVAAQITGSGSSLHFGVSNNYGLGVSHNVMTIRYDQRVGINTTAPAAPLDVRGPAGTTVLQVSDGTYGTFGISFSVTYGIEFGSAAGSNINLKANNIVGLTVNTSGQVGIGPGGLGATPGYALDVRDTVDNVMRIRGGGANVMAWLLRADNGGTPQEYQFGVTKTTHSWGKGFYIYSNTDARRDLFIDADGSMTIGGTGSHLMSATAGDVTHRMIISGGATGWAFGLNRPGDSAGTTLTWASFASATWTTRATMTTSLLTLTMPLSIGTSAARVNPASGYSITNYGQGNSYWLFGANTNFVSGIHFGDPADDDVGRIEYAHNGDYMAFWTNAAERMRIASDGKVGINTTGAAAMFDVNGDVAHRMAALTLANGGNHNVARPNSSSLRIAGPTGAFQITGLTGGADGIFAVLINTTAHQMTLDNDSGSSTAGNRIFTDSGGNLNCKHAILQYDATSSRWRVISFRT